MTYGAPATGELKGGSHAWALNEEESQPYLRQAPISESIFLIQPMSIQPAPAKRCLGISLKQTPAAKPLSLRQRCTARCATNRMAAASHGKPSFTNWKIASAVYGPIT